MSSTTRIQWVDCTRALAIIFVVLCHATHFVFPMNVESLTALSLHNELFAISSFTLGRLGVPFFLFITGFLLLDRPYGKDQCLAFWKRRWLPLLICCEVWILIYELFLQLTQGGVTPTGILKVMLFLDSVNLTHYWYIPIILGLYLFIPIIGMALQRLPYKVVAIPVLILFVYIFAVPVINVLLNVKGHTPVTSVLDPGFSGGMYGIYLLAGWAVKKGALKRTNSFALGLGALASFVLLVWLQYYADASGIGYYVWYDNGLLFVCAFCLFGLLSHAKQIRLYKLFKVIAYYSFAIYLVHMLVRNLLGPVLLGIATPLPVLTILIAVIVFVISLGISYLIGLIPHVGKRLLYLK